MDTIILAAGYGTRLSRDLESSEEYKFLLGIPKCLLPVGSKPLISHWIPHLDLTCQRIVVVTNQVFYAQLQLWKDQLEPKYKDKVSILNDLTDGNSIRLGAVADIQLAVQYLQRKNDILVVAGDTLFYQSFNLRSLVQEFSRLQQTVQEVCYLVHTDCSEENVSKHGILELGDNNRVLRLLEKPKPQDTVSRFQCPCFYILSNPALVHLDAFLMSKEDQPIESKDATGTFISYLINHTEVYSYYLKGRFDVGNLKSYLVCHEYFNQKENQK
ncbi:uncharacterized protein LOC111710651 isoform X1 [Eurytemora carolleeae]|uniref:uncharacterized protein LOC111710651 isoform X1 n=1 Tax=Eurytemora carolleeae TaxID=1294199 RepID=UPI000C76807B|nr:uncharacterized protein LOC111710651 isoform X1 [Eurytemora carolleeae]|eukprot:XP_023340570.1 uncharacterized protein LOC111710651 isoform X1 [Eurytemora affinis]